MKPWKTLETAEALGGGKLVLQERDGTFVIRVDGHELMSSRTHRSEEALATVALEDRPARARRRILIGGLGMGFTLRAALERLPPGGEVVVAELSPAVVAWNRGVLAPLAKKPLEDKRVTVVEGDVLSVAKAERQGFDVILLDVDNGPSALVSKKNRRLYELTGIETFHRALVKGGTWVVWSAGPAPAFLARLGKGGFDAEVRPVKSDEGRRHVFFFATRR